MSESSYERIEGVEVGQYVGYRFFRVDPAWRRLPIEERIAGKEAVAEVVDEFAERMEGLRVYSTVGVRPEADFFLWSITQTYDDLLALGSALNGTPLAGWLETPYSYLGTTKPSVYTDKKRVRQGRVAPRNAPYLVVYPFVKLRPWYFLTFEERADRDARARGGRRHVRHGDEPHDVLLRDRRPGVHPGLRDRGARRLHAPDDDPA